jgi:hypothetical protein
VRRLALWPAPIAARMAALPGIVGIYRAQAIALGVLPTQSQQLSHSIPQERGHLGRSEIGPSGAARMPRYRTTALPGSVGISITNEIARITLHKSLTQSTNQGTDTFFVILRYRDLLKRSSE